MTFQLAFSLEYFVLRTSSSFIDSRKFKGKPLRHFQSLSFLAGYSISSRTSTSDQSDYLYQGQISCVVSGIDKHKWIAYLLADTYLESGEQSFVEYLHDDYLEGGLRRDPLTDGVCDAEMPTWDPREYFLKVLEMQSSKVRQEWVNLVNSLQRMIMEYYVSLLVFCFLFQSQILNL
jgi:hypothetical protein